MKKVADLVAAASGSGKKKAGQNHAGGAGTSTAIKVNVWAQDIDGILCYIDTENNIYSAKDVVQGIKNPAVVGEYALVGGKYTLIKFDEEVANGISTA